MSDESEARLLATLDSMSAKLENIENRLSEIVRLEERVNSQKQIVHSHGQRLNNHSDRLRDTELWQAGRKDSSSIDRLVIHMQEEISRINSKVENIETSTDRSKGQKDIVKEIIKWLLAIAAAIIIFSLKGA